MSNELTISYALSFGYTHLVGENSRLEAELLLAHLLNVPRVFLYTHSNQPLAPDCWQQYQILLQRARLGEPIAYLLGKKEFWSLELEVNPDTLIPRPETELLVGTTLKALPAEFSLTVADLGVGSGAIAIALASERKNWLIYAVDKSVETLKVAQRNADKYHLNNIQFVHSDWYAQMPKVHFDAIISNPPYIRADDPHLTELGHEPRTALVAGKQGLECLEQIIQGANDFLKKGGWLLLEHGYDQGEAVTKLLKAAGFNDITNYLDYNNIYRVSSGRKG